MPKYMTYILLFLLFLLLSGCSGLTEDVPLEVLAAEETGTEAVLEASVTGELQTFETPVILDHEQIQAQIDSIAAAYGAVGVQVAVVDNGTIAGSYAYGWATVGTDPMTADHKIRVASVSKVVVGIAAMLLQEDGIIDLDQDIGLYWNTTAVNPAYPSTPITIRNILNHTSSILCYGDDCSMDYSSVRYRLANGGFSALQPGAIESYYYNNYAFRLLGMTLELASGTCLDELLSSRLYETMDIDASFASGDISDTSLLATLYRESGEIARTADYQKTIHMPDTPGSNGSYFAGGLTISAEDMAKLVALLSCDGCYDGVQLLAPSSVAQMESYLPQALSDGSYQAYPLCFWPGMYGRDGIYYHTGTAYGVNSCISYDPDTADGVVVLTTGANGASDSYVVSRVCSEINVYIYDLI